jgi:hypothetical protein
MPRVDLFPHKATSITERGYQFEQVALTVREAFPAKDGVSKAGREYHLPPRIKFVEDPSGEDWMWKAWDDSKESFGDYTGVLPVAGDVVNVKLKAGFKGGEDSGEYYRDVHDLYLTTGAATNVPASSAADAPQLPTGISNISALGRLSTQEQIAATAMTNNLGLAVFDATPDGDKWKETIREAVKKILTSQIPPSLLGIAEAGAVEVAPEPEVEAPPVEAAAPPQEEDVEELPW